MRIDHLRCPRGPESFQALPNDRGARGPGPQAVPGTGRESHTCGMADTSRAMATTIQLSQETRAKLSRLKASPRETLRGGPEQAPRVDPRGRRGGALHACVPGRAARRPPGAEGGPRGRPSAREEAAGALTAWSVRWTERAVRDLDGLDRKVAARGVAKIELAAANPHHFLRRPVGSDEHKLRIGDYRLLAFLDHETQTIFVERVEDRSRIYARG